tara:strand:+ start:169 stop:351 length:183 start_codon:yes stop_codon:yes gene_type:complete
MPKMTKAQAKRRLNEAMKKIQSVYIQGFMSNPNNMVGHVVQTTDMNAIEKIISKCLKRLN